MSALASTSIHRPLLEATSKTAVEIVESEKAQPRDLRGYSFVELPPEEKAAEWMPFTANAARQVIRHCTLVNSQDRIPGSHNRRPVFLMAFRPSDGQFVGTNLDVTIVESADRLVMIPSNHIPTMAELGQILYDRNSSRVRWEAT